MKTAYEFITVFLLVIASTVAWSQSNVDEQINELEQELQQISSMAADDEDVNDEITALSREIESLKTYASRLAAT